MVQRGEIAGMFEFIVFENLANSEIRGRYTSSSGRSGDSAEGGLRR